MPLGGEGQPVFPVPFTGSAASCWISFSTASLFLSLPARLLDESPGNCRGPQRGCLPLRFSGVGDPDMLMEGGPGPLASSLPNQQGERMALGVMGCPTASLVEL